MPREVFGADHVFLGSDEVLTHDEIARLATIFVSLGVHKVRITGGEPLARPGVEGLIGALAGVEGIDDLALTTNGTRLARKAELLREHGLHRLTVSLDSLDQSVFSAINDVAFPVARVLEGIKRAERAGFKSIKINMVVRRGLNDHDVVPMAKYFRGSGHIVRFIEYMDVGATNGWKREDVVPSEDILRAIDAVYPLVPVEGLHRGEVARRYRYADGAGEIGVISSITQPFCGDCSRARIAADGVLYTCLFSSTGLDLRSLVRSGARDAEVAATIRSVWARRADRFSEQRSAADPDRRRVEMSVIGG